MDIFCGWVVDDLDAIEGEGGLAPVVGTEFIGVGDGDEGEFAIADVLAHADGGVVDGEEGGFAGWVVLGDEVLGAGVPLAEDEVEEFDIGDVVGVSGGEGFSVLAWG